MDMLWSASTTMRNPERTLQFLKTVMEIEGEVWNDETQCKYQTLLIKNRYYKPTSKNLSEKLNEIVNNYKHEMTLAEASKIFLQKRYEDAPMRGRTSFDPLEKLGLVSLDKDEESLKRVRVTKFGHMFLNGEINIGELVFTSLLKMQFPNPLEDARQDYDIKPFICTLRIIKRVNELCLECNIEPTGISREEFGIFVLSLKSYKDIDIIATRLVEFRKHKRGLATEEEKK